MGYFTKVAVDDDGDDVGYIDGYSDGDGQGPRFSAANFLPNSAAQFVKFLRNSMALLSPNTLHSVANRHSIN